MGATAGFLLAREDGRRGVRDGFNLNLLNRWLRHSAVKMPRKTCEHLWTAGFHHMHLIMHRDGADIMQAEAKMLRK